MASQFRDRGVAEPWSVSGRRVAAGLRRPEDPLLIDPCADLPLPPVPGHLRPTSGQLRLTTRHGERL